MPHILGGFVEEKNEEAMYEITHISRNNWNVQACLSQERISIQENKVVEKAYGVLF